MIWQGGMASMSMQDFAAKENFPKTLTFKKINPGNLPFNGAEFVDCFDSWNDLLMSGSKRNWGALCGFKVPFLLSGLRRE